MAKPTHRLFVPCERKGEDGSEKTYWREVGAIYPHGKGKGMSIVFDGVLPLDGRAEAFPIEDPEPEPPPTKPNRR